MLSDAQERKSDADSCNASARGACCAQEPTTTGKGEDNAMTAATTATRARFSLGRLLATPGALEALADAGGSHGILGRHAAGDWGDVCAEDHAANDAALRDGTRLLSAYVLPNGARVWIITEADRSATTILLPEEY